MYQPKSIEELVNEIKLSVVNQGSPLNDISEGSVLSSLLRAIASTHQRQELVIEDVIASFYLNLAEKEDLDRKAADYALQRKSGQVSSGSVLAISQEDAIFIPNNTILTDPVTGVQLRVLIDNSITLNTEVERRLNVQSVNTGERTNLVAGTRLISATLVSASFVVGSHRTSAGEICGDLSGGRNSETDKELRQRVINTSINSRGTTREATKNALLQEPSVQWASVESGPGIVKAWVDAPYKLSNSEIAVLSTVANNAKAAGTVLDLRQAERELIEVNVNIKPTKTSDLQSLTDNIVGIVRTYLRELRLGEPFSRESLLNIIFPLEDVISASVIEPQEDYQPNAFSVIRASKVTVSYETN